MEKERSEYIESIRELYHFGEGTGAMRFMESMDEDSYNNVKKVLNNKSSKKVLLQLIGRWEKEEKKRLREEGYKGEDLKEELYGQMAHREPGSAFSTLLEVAGRNPDYALNIMKEIGDSKKPEIEFHKYLNLKYARPEKSSEGLEKARNELGGHENLEQRTKILPVISGGSLIIGLLFLSPTITGNVIGISRNITSNLVGSILIVIGLIAGFFWFKKK
jgi:hypothetical protein